MGDELAEAEDASVKTPGGAEWLFLFQLPPGRAALAAVRSTDTLLGYLLSRRPHNQHGAPA